METKKIPAVPWFTWPSNEPHLIGSQCQKCKDYFFPKVPVCRNPDCRSKDVEEVLLSRTGKLWSYITQQYAPPPPFPASQPFVPYAIAEVKLPEGIRVLGQVASGTPFESLKIGIEMETVAEGYCQDEQGNEVVIWKFKPVSGGKA